MAELFSIVAAALYLFSAVKQYARIKDSDKVSRKLVISSASVAVLAHWIGWIIPLMADSVLNLSFFNGGSLISLVIALIITVSAFRKPVENLFIGLFPMAALIIVLDLLIPADVKPIAVWQRGLFVHILLSVLAYSVLIIAAFQAILLIVQDHHLKHKKMTGIVRILPPLQTMDKLLFEMLWTGVFLLTLAIMSGFAFLDDLFAQHLVHKTVLTLLAWGIFAALLFGRFQFGWRGTVASKWTLAGSSFLILAYFGSKLVLEIILNKV